MLSVALKSIILSVILLNVIMLNVVVPTCRHQMLKLTTHKSKLTQDSDRECFLKLNNPSNIYQLPSSISNSARPFNLLPFSLVPLNQLDSCQPGANGARN
jgi:hypothetical protein